MKFLQIALVSLLVPFSAFAVSDKDRAPPPEEKKNTGALLDEGPWLTGPLLTASAHTIPKGHFNLEPYLFVNNNIGHYNNHWHLHRSAEPSHNVNFQGLVQIGLLSFMDLSIVPQFFYNWDGGASSWRYGDLPMKVGFQLLNDEADIGMPALKFAIGEVFPVGLYENLDPAKKGTDMGGGGSYATNFEFVLSTLYHFKGPNFLAMRWQLASTVFSNVEVHGLNTYGGDATTVGRVHPGTAFNFLWGIEYTVTQHFALALDISNVYVLKTKFKGTTVEQVGNNKNAYQFSLAPAVEWNFNKSVGLIGGVWFTAVGYNSAAFTNGVIALNWYI